MGAPAIGQVPTAGYSDARLDQRMYIVDPGDDVIDFDFMARPPGGLAAQVISQVVAFHDIPLQGIAGVRIPAERNRMKPSSAKSIADLLLMGPAGRQRNGQVGMISIRARWWHPTSFGRRSR